MTRPAAARRFTAGVLTAFALGVASCAGMDSSLGPAAPAPASSAQAGTTQAGTTQAGTTQAAPSPTEPAPSPAEPAPAASLPASSTATGPAEISIRPATPEPAPTLSPPVRVQVDGTGIDLEVVPTGVEDNGAMSLPGNHYQAGWYRYGPGPGASRGSAVLAAHVDSRTEALPIAGLKDVKAGTQVTVTLEDGSAVIYRTEQVENISKRSLDGHRLFDRTGSHVLKLVTCGGRWLDVENDYEDNVVLTAVPVP